MEKRKFLFDSLSGLIGDIAWQVSKEGHEVRYYIKDQKEADIADGFVAKSENPEKDAEWADIIVFDDTLGQGEKAHALRAQGKKVIGGSAYSDRLRTIAPSDRKNSRKPESTSSPIRNSIPSTKPWSTWSRIPIATSSSPAVRLRTLSGVCLSAKKKMDKM